MLKKSLLLFLMSTNLSANWQFEDTGAYTICLFFIVGGITKAIKDLQKKVEDEKKKSDQGLLEISSEQSLEDLQASVKILETAQIVVGTVALTLFFPALYCILEDEYYKIFPTEEQKIGNQNEHEKLQNLIAQKNFRNCLFHSDRNDSRNNDFNCPETCKELARVFVESQCQQSKDEIIKMIERFDNLGKTAC